MDKNLILLNGFCAQSLTKPFFWCVVERNAVARISNDKEHQRTEWPTLSEERGRTTDQSTFKKKIGNRHVKSKDTKKREWKQSTRGELPGTHFLFLGLQINGSVFFFLKQERKDRFIAPRDTPGRAWHCFLSSEPWRTVGAKQWSMRVGNVPTTRDRKSNALLSPSFSFKPLLELKEWQRKRTLPNLIRSEIQLRAF